MKANRELVEQLLPKGEVFPVPPLPTCWELERILVAVTKWGVFLCSGVGIFLVLIKPALSKGTWTDLEFEALLNLP